MKFRTASLLGFLLAGVVGCHQPHASHLRLPHTGSARYAVQDFGAAGDAHTLDTGAIQQAIDAASASGGGVVDFDPGDYRSGSICLRSNVTLHLEAGATIWGSTRREDYTQEHPHLIYAEDADNVAIRGRGTINGNGTSFWKRAKSRWVTRDWRPRQMLEFSSCRNIVISGITLRNSPYWTVRMLNCDLVNIRGINILNGMYGDDGVNTDGIGVSACTRVRISDCCIEGGDDAIVVSTGRGGRGVCRDVVVTNCVLASTEVAFRVLAYAPGHTRLESITLANCAIRDAGCGIGCMVQFEGVIDGVTVDNVSMTLTNGGQPVLMWVRGHPGKPWGTIRNVSISNVNAVADGCIFISGAPDRHLKGISFDNVRLFMRGGQDSPYHEAPPFPFLPWQHRHCPNNILCRWVDDLKLRNVQVAWNTPEKPEWGSAVRCWHVNGLEIDQLDGRQSLGSGKPAIRLKCVRDAMIRNCHPPAGTSTFLEIAEGTKNVSLMNNDLSRAEKMFDLASGVESGELFLDGNRPPQRHLPELEKPRFTQENARALTEELRAIAGATQEVFTVAFSPDGKTLASGGADYAVKLWDAATGRKVRTLWGHTEEVFDVAFSPDGTKLASASDDYTTKTWDLTTGKRIRTHGDLEYYMWSTAFSPDGRILAASNYEAKMVLWDAESGQLIRELRPHTNWVFSLAFSPDGKMLASGYWDKTRTSESCNDVTHICLWDTATWKEKRILAGHPKWIWSLAFSPDAKLLASAGEDRAVRLWDTATGGELRSLAGHTNEVTSVSFSPDGKTLASGSKDETIKLWDVETGEEKASLSGHTGFIWSVAFSPDGKTLASGGADGTVRLWDAERGRATRTLRNAEEGK